MLAGALLILAPLFLGFALPLHNRHMLTVIHYTVEGLVYFILALLGLALGQMEGLTAQLGNMAFQVLALVVVLLVVLLLVVLVLLVQMLLLLLLLFAYLYEFL